jgi:hypothetical protein
MQQALDKICLLMAANALAGYPDHNKRFNVCTDASDFQLGTCIFQEQRLVAYFLLKLTKSQQNYTTMEKEMLSVVASLKEFLGMILGADIHVFTDHKTWHLILSKYNACYAGMQKLKCFHPFYTISKAPAIF